MEAVGRARAADGEDPLGALAYRALALLELRCVDCDRPELPTREVLADRVRNDEEAVREALHQRTRAEAVGAMVGEVRLAEHEESRQRRLEVVVDPQPAHRV